MRHVLILLVALMIGGLIAPANKAAAGPLPAVTGANLAPAMVQKVDYWHRYWRHHGYGPDVVVVPDVDVAAPPVIVETLPPPRPLSCGEYHYWDGVQCVDARFNKPYLGPK